MFLRYILCAAAAYLLGSISTGVLLSHRLFHDDVRKHGSGGTGATNMLRTYRLKAALLTFAGDAAKAALAVLLGRYLAGFEGGCVAAVFAIVGHMWPLYFGFRGGKGIACTVGAIAVLYQMCIRDRLQTLGSIAVVVHQQQALSRQRKGQPSHGLRAPLGQAHLPRQGPLPDVQPTILVFPQVLRGLRRGKALRQQGAGQLFRAQHRLSLIHI